MSHQAHSIHAEAERLGVSVLLVDDRPIAPHLRRRALVLQARAFAEILTEFYLPVQRVTEEGVVVVGETRAPPMLSLTVAEMRAALRVGRGKAGFLQALLSLEKAQPLLTYLTMDVTRGLARMLNRGQR